MARVGSSNKGSLGGEELPQSPLVCRGTGCEEVESCRLSAWGYDTVCIIRLQEADCCVARNQHPLTALECIFTCTTRKMGERVITGFNFRSKRREQEIKGLIFS